MQAGAWLSFLKEGIASFEEPQAHMNSNFLQGVIVKVIEIRIDPWSLDLFIRINFEKTHFPFSYEAATYSPSMTWSGPRSISQG